MISLVFLALVVTTTPPPGAAAQHGYDNITERIQARALTSTDPEKLVYLCDYFGQRHSGSEGLTAASHHLLSLWEDEELENVREEGGFTIPRWIRGNEYIDLLAPVQRRLHMTGLGHSVGGHVEGEVVIVTSWEDLDTKGQAGLLADKIVLINVVFTTYGATTGYRTNGPRRAAEYGAIAALVRSVTPFSLQSPHTGITYYEDVEPIPAAALTLEDADLLQRFVDRGESVRVHVHMEAKFEADVAGFNIVAELEGSTHPNEVVVMGGHIDSWDITEGAQDDGGGLLAAWEALRVLADLVREGAIPRPRRTVRLVGWTDEESGARGAWAYRSRHFSSLDDHVFAMESDSGHFNPLGISFTGEPAALAVLESIGEMYCQAIGAGGVTTGGGGVDIDPIMQCGVPGAGIVDDCFPGPCVGLDATYFVYHHTSADTGSLVKGGELPRLAALMATYAYVVADMPEPLARGPNNCTAPLHNAPPPLTFDRK